ncbi:MAG: hypothetical protein QNJ45_20735 [Ardenticatenaceae bacterium]|nr:hypothetical protein [Ardenticatenaceae bacterium]
MTDALQKLQRDLTIGERMVEEMAGYLQAETLFGRMPPSLPALTLGGYLMRQHRLLALQEALPPADQTRVDNMINTFDQILSERIVRSENRAHREIGARLRQWEEYIRDLRRDLRGNAGYFATAVEPRVMIAALLEMLSEPPYQLQEEFAERLELLDRGLSGVWQAGPFVWPEEWESAYPANEYWYLYGEPRIVKREK